MKENTILQVQTSKVTVRVAVLLYTPKKFVTLVDSVRLNSINHLVGFIPCQICLYFSNS